MTALHATNFSRTLAAWDEEAPARPTRRRRVRPIAAFHREPAMAAAAAFDRETGKPFRLIGWRLIGRCLRIPLDGDFTDRGPTRRRHIQVTGISYIGKERPTGGRSSSSRGLMRGAVIWSRVCAAGL